MSFTRSLKEFMDRHSLLGMAILRIGVGIMFAIAAVNKVKAGSQWPDRMLGFINFQAEKTYPFYRSFLEAVVIPNKTFFGYFVAYGEALVAISLILGLFTRWGAALGLFLVINFFLAKGGPFWVPSANDPIYILALAALLFSQSGLYFGLDGKRSNNP